MLRKLIREVFESQNRLLSHSDMLKMGATGSLSRAYLKHIPVGKIVGLDPEPADWTDDNGDVHKFMPGQEIKSPIEVIQDGDQYLLQNGNHRVKQANVNGDHVILALVQPERLSESYQPNMNKFPISALVKHAKHFKEFKDFSRFYSFEIGHGYYWHLTDNPDFSISGQNGPRDMSSMSNGKVSENGAIMITSHLDYWDSHYNEEPGSWKRDIKRNYVVLFDPSDVDPAKLKQVSRGYGNEVYLGPSDAQKLRQVGVYNLKYAKGLDRKFSSLIPQSEKDLLDIWNFAHKF